MNFLVTITMGVADGTPNATVEGMRTRDKARSRDSVPASRLFQLWLLPLAPGEWRTLELNVRARPPEATSPSTRTTAPPPTAALDGPHDSAVPPSRPRAAVRPDNRGTPHPIGEDDRTSEGVAAIAPNGRCRDVVHDPSCAESHDTPRRS